MFVDIKTGAYLDYPVHSRIPMLKRAAILLADTLWLHYLHPLSFEDKSILNSFEVWCRGTSGILVAAFLTNTLQEKYGVDLRVCLVRKDNENSHSPSNRTLNDRTNIIIVDDRIESGNTLIQIGRHLQMDNNANLRVRVLIVTSGVCEAVTEQWFPNLELFIH